MNMVALTERDASEPKRLVALAADGLITTIRILTCLIRLQIRYAS